MRCPMPARSLAMLVALRLLTAHAQTSREKSNNEVLPDTTIEVFENRAIWEELPRPFLEALAERFDSVEVASNFAFLCEESGILENNIRSISKFSPEFAVGAVASILTSYGNAMGEQGEFIKAKEGLEYALVWNPSHVPAWLSMAIVSVNLGDCTSAVDWADKSLNFQPDPYSENSWERAMAVTCPHERVHPLC